MGPVSKCGVMKGSCSGGKDLESLLNTLSARACWMNLTPG